METALGSATDQLEQKHVGKCAETGETCRFFLVKKQRYCKFPPKPGERYCSQHLSPEVAGRVPCPFDSHHTVAIDELEHHKEICNSRSRPAPYRKPGINAFNSTGSTLRAVPHSSDAIHSHAPVHAQKRARRDSPPATPGVVAQKDENDSDEGHEVAVAHNLPADTVLRPLALRVLRCLAQCSTRSTFAFCSQSCIPDSSATGA